MCDIDSVAVKAAKENATLNNVIDLVEIEEADLFNTLKAEIDLLVKEKLQNE